MQVAEKADRAAIRAEASQHAHGTGLRDALRGHRVALLVECLEMAPVENDVRRVLAAEHGIGLGPRRHQDRARRQHHPLRRLVRLRCRPGQLQRRRLAEEIDLDLDRGQQFGKANALLHRLCYLLVIESVARRVDEAAPVGDRHPAPAI
jgi:hypothetical protein